MKRPAPKRPTLVIFIALAFAPLAGCVAPLGPVQVTRFHAPDPAALAPGSFVVEAGPGGDPAGLEFRSYAAAVAQQLSRLNFIERSPPGSRYVARVSVERATFRPDRNRGPVSVGVGGSTGSYGSGVGLGVGIDLSGPPPELVETRLSVALRDRASGKNVWEGRSAFTVRASSPLAITQLGAAKMAEALFRGFPGVSGETIDVR